MRLLPAQSTRSSKKTSTRSSKKTNGTKAQERECSNNIVLGARSPNGGWVHPALAHSVVPLTTLVPWMSGTCNYLDQYVTPCAFFLIWSPVRRMRIVYWTLAWIVLERNASFCKKSACFHTLWIPVGLRLDSVWSPIGLTLTCFLLPSMWIRLDSIWNPIGLACTPFPIFCIQNANPRRTSRLGLYNILRP